MRGPAIDAQPRLTISLSAKGEVTGRVLTLNTAAGSRTKNLAAESFASAAQSNVVVFGQSDAIAGSTVGAIDLQTGCEYSLWSSSDVARSALIDPSLQNLYVHMVKAGDRSDVGVARVAIASGAAATALPALAATAPFGVTFSTSLRWSLDGDGLAVQSCGLAACRTRVLELAGGAIETFADEAQGQIIGLTAGELVTFDACPDLPCSLAAVDRPTKSKTDFDVDGLRRHLGRRRAGHRHHCHYSRRNEGDPAMKRRLPGALAAMLLIAAMGAPATLATSVTPFKNAKWQRDQQVSFMWKSDAKPPAWMRPAVLDAADDARLDDAGSRGQFQPGGQRRKLDRLHGQRLHRFRHRLRNQQRTLVVHAAPAAAGLVIRLGQPALVPVL